jgi:protein TonB
MYKVPIQPLSNFKLFLLLAALVHGFIIFNLDLQPIIPMPKPQKMLIMLKPYPVPAIKLTSNQLQTSTNNHSINYVDTSIEITRLTKALEKKITAYANRPRRRAISANTTDKNYSNYLETWRRKVELVGNQNYPETARKLKLHGNLILQVTLTSDGKVQQIRIVHSSGNQILDDAAIRIVRLAAPYEPFPKEIREEVEILDITRTWQFINGAAYFNSEFNNTNQIQSKFSMLNK